MRNEGEDRTTGRKPARATGPWLQRWRADCVLHGKLGWEGYWAGRGEISGDGGEGNGGGVVDYVEAADHRGEEGGNDYGAGEGIFAAGNRAQIVEDRANR